MSYEFEEIELDLGNIDINENVITWGYITTFYILYEYIKYYEHLFKQILDNSVMIGDRMYFTVDYIDLTVSQVDVTSYILLFIIYVLIVEIIAPNYKKIITSKIVLKILGR